MKSTELRQGDHLADGATIIGPALAADVPLGEPNNPNAAPYDPETDVAYPIAYLEGGTGVRVYARDIDVKGVTRD